MILSVGEKIYMIILYPILARVEMVFPNFLKFFWQNEKSRRPAGAAAMRCSLLGRNCGLNLRDNRGAVDCINPFAANQLVVVPDGAAADFLVVRVPECNGIAVSVCGFRFLLAVRVIRRERIQHLFHLRFVGDRDGLAGRAGLNLASAAVFGSFGADAQPVSSKSSSTIITARADSLRGLNICGHLLNLWHNTGDIVEHLG